MHPTAFARPPGLPYGKTSWLVLDATGSAVHLGWREDVDPAELADRRDAQDGAWMLERMHRIEVSRGDGILVPAGAVHAIGAGAFVLEAQEPTDFSILLEWSVTTETRDGSHLGLGFDTAMGAVARALADGPLRELVSHVDLDGPGRRPAWSRRRTFSGSTGRSRCGGAGLFARCSCGRRRPRQSLGGSVDWLPGRPGGAGRFRRLDVRRRARAGLAPRRAATDLVDVGAG